MFESRAQNASAQVTEINHFWNRSWSSRTRYHPRNSPKTFRSTVNLYKSWLQHCVTAPLPIPIRQCFRNPRRRWAHERKEGRTLLTLLGKLSRLVIAIPEQQGNLFCFIHSIFPNREWSKPRAHFWLPARETYTSNAGNNLLNASIHVKSLQSSWFRSRTAYRTFVSSPTKEGRGPKGLAVWLLLRRNTTRPSQRCSHEH